MVITKKFSSDGSANARYSGGNRGGNKNPTGFKKNNAKQANNKHAKPFNKKHMMKPFDTKKHGKPGNKYQAKPFGNQHGAVMPRASNQQGAGMPKASNQQGAVMPKANKHQKLPEKKDKSYVTFEEDAKHKGLSFDEDDSNEEGLSFDEDDSNEEGLSFSEDSGDGMYFDGDDDDLSIDDDLNDEIASSSEDEMPLDVKALSEMVNKKQSKPVNKNQEKQVDKKQEKKVGKKQETKKRAAPDSNDDDKDASGLGLGSGKDVANNLKNVAMKKMKTESDVLKPSVTENDDKDVIDAVPDSKDKKDIASEEKTPAIQKKVEFALSPAKKVKNAHSKSASGEKLLDLGKNRYVSCTMIQKQKMVNIREFFEKDGQLFPFLKRGISLPLDQWKELTKIIPDVEELIKAT